MCPLKTGSFLLESSSIILSDILWKLQSSSVAIYVLWCWIGDESESEDNILMRHKKQIVGEMAQ